MSYRIISTEKLYGDHFSRLESGVTVLARVSCALGVTPQEAALKQVTPYGDTKVALIAYHDGSGEGSAVIDDFEASVIVKVDARYGDEESSAVIHRYLDLLGRWLSALPCDEDEIIAVLRELSDWSDELRPKDIW